MSIDNTRDGILSQVGNPSMTSQASCSYLPSNISTMQEIEILNLRVRMFYISWAFGRVIEF